MVAGRDGELRELGWHLDRAAEGHGRVVLVEGPPGIGKSALVAELRALAAERGIRSLAATGSELEREFPFGVVRRLLEPVVAEDPDAVRRGAAALAATVLGVPGDPAPGEPGYAVLHGLYWFVHDLAGHGPLVLCVDDVQWADAPSLRFLDHLATRLDGLPVLAALAVRAGDATLSVGPVARLAQHSDVHALAVGPLTRDAAARIVADGLGPAVPAELVAACHEVTGGNPFLLLEVVGELRRSGAGAAADPAQVRRLAPPAIVRSLRLRLHALPPHAVALARAIAILGDGCDVREAATLARLRSDAAQDAADVLARTDLLVAGRPLRFTHAVVLSAARETMGAAVRSDLHRRAAAMAAERPGGLDAAASHLLAVDPVGDHAAAALLRRAAALARRRGAADAAATYLRRALAEPPAPEEVLPVLTELAGAAAVAGQPDALVFAERVLEVGEEPELRLRAAREAALLHLTAGRPEAAAETLAAVLEHDGLPPQDRMAGEGLLLVTAAMAAEPRRAHASRFAGARRRAQDRRDGAPATLLVLAGFESIMVEGEVERGSAWLDRALAGRRLLHETTADSPFPYIAANGLVVSGRYDLAEGLIDEVIADAARRGSIRAYALATAQRGLCRLRQGRLALAEADARAALEVRDGRTVLQRTVAAAACAGALTAMGDLDGATRMLATLPAEGRRPETHVGVVAEDVRARLLAAQGRWHEVLAACASCEAWERAFAVRHGGWPAWRGLAAQAHAALGDRERAVAHAADGVRLARAYGVPRTLGLSLRSAGLVSGDVAQLREAVEVLEQAGVRAEAAYARLDLGLTLAGDARRQALERALTEGEAVAARPVERAARDALVRAGARPRRSRRSGVQALTAGERRVAELAAAGASNREVAERLFLTLKTVENHLTATYRKLGISSRAQLADRLSET